MFLHLQSMVIYYIVKFFDDICISYTLLFCILYTLLYGDIIADGVSEIWLNNRQSPVAVPFSVRNALSRILDRFV